MSVGSRKPLLLGLAVAASLLELGPIVALLYRGDGIAAVLLAGLAYQLGNAVRCPPALAGRLAIGVAATTAAGLLLLAPVAGPAWMIAIALLSWTLQTVRRVIAAGEDVDMPTTAQKRIARVSGFVLAGLMPMQACLLLALLAIGAALPSMRVARPEASRAGSGFGHPLEWTMLIHQTHYFAYAYAIPLLAAAPTLGGVPFVGIWFACGWVSYLSAEALWRRFPPTPVFVLGHLCLAVVLLLLAANSDVPWAAVTFWVLSGLGGGTVYCLTTLHRRHGLSHVRLERAEDTGHLLGVALALVSVHLCGLSAGALAALGSVCALGAALAMLAFGIREAGSANTPQGGANARN